MGAYHHYLISYLLTVPSLCCGVTPSSVKSIARSFEESNSGENSTTSTSISTGGNQQQDSVGVSTSHSPPTLHNRASSSSIQTLAASFEQQHHQHSLSSQEYTNNNNNTMTGRRPSNAYGYDTAGMSGNTSRRYASEASTSSASTSSNPRGHHDDGHGHNHEHSNGSGITDTPTLEQAEQDDEFLPMNSPFTPGYSLSANNSTTSSPTSAYRRDSYGNISPEAPASMTAVERREHSRRHSRIHERNLSGGLVPCTYRCICVLSLR